MMKQLSQGLIILSLLFCFNLKSISQTPAQRQVARPKGTTPAPFGFYEYLPSDYLSNPSKTFPLVIFLHGTGEMGNGSANDLKKLINSGGLPGFVNRGKDYPFIMVSPQTSIPFYSITPSLNQLLEYAKTKYRVDVSRIYLTGLSMGGAGTWFFAQDYPDKFAAIVPICGGGLPAAACNIKNIPTWAFHNSGDPKVGVHHTIWMINAIKACGGNPLMTIYQSNAHDAWTATYNDQNMWNWLLSKRKGTPPPVPPANKLPIVSAGTDKGMTLPSNALNITAAASDPDGMITSYAWTKVSGPNATMGGVNSNILNLSGLVAGTYVFRITVKDNSDATAFDEISVFVNPATNLPPVVNLGPDKGATLPNNALNITAAASDPDGTISSYTWTKLNGPNATMGGINTNILSLSGLVAGTYNFRVTVKDNKNASAFDDIQLIVYPATNIAPVVNLGPDKGTTLPNNALNITAAASDPDGTISSYAWTKLSGPNTNMGGINTKILNLSGLVTGTYVFKVTVKDNSNATAFDEIKLFVYPANNGNNTVSNIPPVVTVGSDKGTTMPYNALNLTAVASDQDGSITSYSWAKISGPNATLSGMNTNILNLSGLVVGTYLFRITVKDNQNATAFDDVQVFVHPQNSNSSARVSSESLETDTRDYQINLFPNPTSGQFELDFGKKLEANTQVQISDITGRKVFLNREIKAEGFESRPVFDVSFIPQGTYLVRIKTGYHEKILRLLKL